MSMEPQPPWEGPLQCQSHAFLSLVAREFSWMPCCYWTLPTDLGLERAPWNHPCRHCCQSLCHAINHTLPSEIFVLVFSRRQILSTVTGVTIYMKYVIPHQTSIHDSRKSTEYIYGIWHCTTSVAITHMVDREQC